MSKPKTGYSDDKLYSSLNNNYADNVNFFSGKEVVVESKSDAEFNKKEEEETHEENVKNEEEEANKSADEEMDDEQVAGIESVVANFGRIQFRDKYEDPIYDGTESLVSFGKNLLISLWEMIKDIGRWIVNLFGNKLARIDTRVRYTEQRRKISGIKEGECKYPYSIKRLMIPSKVAIEPDWTYNCADVGIKFYRKVLEAHLSLKDRIGSGSITNLDQVKKNTVEESIARVITGRGFNSTNLAQTDILPGNRIFTVRAPLPESPDAALTYFIESSIDPVLKKKTFISTPYLIDNALKTLTEYRAAVNVAQKTSSELQRKFESEVNALMKGESVESEVRMYLKWLVVLNKRMLNVSLQHAMHTIEALDDFINAGLR